MINASASLRAVAPEGGAAPRDNGEGRGPTQAPSPLRPHRSQHSPLSQWARAPHEAQAHASEGGEERARQSPGPAVLGAAGSRVLTWTVWAGGTPLPRTYTANAMAMST